MGHYYRRAVPAGHPSRSHNVRVGWQARSAMGSRQCLRRAYTRKFVSPMSRKENVCRRESGKNSSARIVAYGLRGNPWATTKPDIHCGADSLLLKSVVYVKSFSQQLRSVLPDSAPCFRALMRIVFTWFFSIKRAEHDDLSSVAFLKMRLPPQFIVVF
jgi:hypothetical protein